MALDLDALEKLAREATPGPWHYFPPKADECIGPIVQSDGKICAPELHIVQGSEDWPVVMTEQTAEFIASASPETILSLIAKARVTQEIAQDDLSWLSSPTGSIIRRASEWSQKAKEACRDSL